ncbi:MAG: class I SAM-dependent methyltransferase [Nanoarchaeota archaeon]
MISLSQEWAILSKVNYGQEFIDELYNFLIKYNVERILECGCGDGHILHGLALKGICGIGIDADREMINMAAQNNFHKNIEYKLMNWKDLNKIKEKFDAVLCRGNSLSIIDWGYGKEIDSKIARENIVKGIESMLSKIKPNGLFYLDSTSQREIDKGNQTLVLDYPNLFINGKIEYDWGKRTRRTYGIGTVNGESFEGSSVSYLITPKEIEDILKSFNLKKVFYPKIENEKNYDVICGMNN